LKRIVHLKEKGSLNANKKNIEYKYSLSSPKKSVGTIRRGWGVLYPFLRNQERNTKISRTPPRLRAYKWDKHLRA
jgi:hypothetical protein